MFYKDYLKTEYRKNLRYEKLKSCSFKCQNCESRRKLEIHHINYKDLFSCKLSDLECLCKFCYCKKHGRNIPGKNWVNKDIIPTELEKRRLEGEKFVAKSKFFYTKVKHRNWIDYDIYIENKKNKYDIFKFIKINKEDVINKNINSIKEGLSSKNSNKATLKIESIKREILRKNILNYE